VSSAFGDYAETASDWLWETGPDHLITRLSDLYDVGIPPSRVLAWLAGRLHTDVESEPKNGDCIGDARRASAIRNFVYTVGTGSPVYIQTSGKPFITQTAIFSAIGAAAAT